MGLDLLSGEQRAPAECRIYLHDQEVPEYYPFLRELEVDTSREEAWSATLRLATVRDEHGSWSVQDEALLRPWAEITLAIVFGDDEQRLFKGYIREVNADFPESAGEAEIVVECQDQSLRLDRTHQRTPWGEEEAPVSDRVIIEEILSHYGLALSPDSKDGQRGLVELPQDSSDIQFLRKRAEENNYELIFYPDQVYFGPYRLDGAGAQATIQVYAGQATNCLRLNVSADGHLPDLLEVEVPAAREGEDSRTLQVYSTLSAMGPERADSRGSGLEPNLDTLSGEGGDAGDQLEARAQARINEYDLHRLQADGELDGSLYGHVLRPGRPVPVDGLGERLSGLYYVDRVAHHFSPDGYYQRFQLLRNAYGDNVETAAPVSPRLAGVL